MNENEFAKAVSGFLENDLTPSERRALLEAAGANPATRSAFISQVRLSVHLAAFHQDPSDRRVVERTQALVGSRQRNEGLRTLGDVQRRILSRPKRRRLSPWGWGAVAAASLLVVAVLFAARIAGGRPESSVITPQVQVPVEQRLPPVEEKVPDRRPEPAPKSPEIVPPVEIPKVKVPEETLPPKPTPAPTVEPVPPSAPPEVPKAPVETKVAVAKVESLTGEAFLWTSSGRKPLRAGQDLFGGEGVQTGAAGKAVVVFADKTRLEAGPGTTVRGLLDQRGKKLRLDRGSLLAQVVKQQADQAMELLTPHGEAKVLGTVFRMVVDADRNDGSTRLEVTEGKVQLKRLGDAKAVDVSPGEYAVAAAGLDLVSYPNPQVFELDQFGSGRECKAATGPGRKLYRDESLGATGGTCVAAPGVGTFLEGAPALAPGSWNLWIRYRDTDRGPVSFQILVDGRVAGTIVGEGFLKTPGWQKWNWRRVAFDTRSKTPHVAIRSTSEAAGYDPRDHSHEVVNRWDIIVLTRDPGFDPEKDLRERNP